MNASLVRKILLGKPQLSAAPPDRLAKQYFDSLHGEPASPLADEPSTDDNSTDDRLHCVDVVSGRNTRRSTTMTNGSGKSHTASQPVKPLRPHPKPQRRTKAKADKK